MPGKSGSSWDRAWERVFQTQEWGKYPPEELVRFTARNFYKAPERRKVKILEMGCGTGANVWYMAREGFSVYGVDASPTAIRTAKERLRMERLNANLKRGDMVSLSFPSGFFDAVVDIAALECNRMAFIRRMCREAHRVLKPGGKFFSMMVACGSWGHGKGRPVCVRTRTGRRVEKGTFTDAAEGPHTGQGVIHFFEKKEIQTALKSFLKVNIEYSLRTCDDMRHTIKHWVVTAVK